MSQTTSKKRRKKKGLKDYLTEYSKGSEIAVRLHQYKSEPTPSYMHIAFRGPVAATPCFKNNRVKGIWLPANVTARLKIMDTLFEEWVLTRSNRPSFEDEQLFMVCRFASKGTRRGTNFDSDNALSTIKDWLEPNIKNGRNRGWGVGLTENDRLIRGYSETKDKTEDTAHITEIAIHRYGEVQHYASNFIKNIIDDRIP